MTLTRLSNSTSLLTRTLNDAHLTRRETEIVLFLQKGLSAAEIAEKLNLSYHTVRTHLKNIYKKLNISSVRELMAFLLKQNAALTQSHTQKPHYAWLNLASAFSAALFERRFLLLALTESHRDKRIKNLKLNIKFLLKIEKYPICGSITDMHMLRPPVVDFFSSRSFPQYWVGVNEMVAGAPAPGRGLYASPCDADSNFDIASLARQL